MYGPLLILIPAAMRMARRPSLTGLGIAFALLFILGLGGTTPLPALLFGKSWEWLTYDRFAFWATLFLLPFTGMLIVLARRRFSRAVGTRLYTALAVSSLIVAAVTIFVPLQPGAVDMSQIVHFLEQEDRASWRYLTFGFGDQLALLSTLTPATTIDGSYHTARALPELRSSGIAQIDTAFWFPNGLSALEPILQKAGAHGVRWGFVNVPQYIPVLERNGWVLRAHLQGGLQVWENPAALAPSISIPRPERPLATFAWGTLPLLSLAATLSLASLRFFPIRTEKILRVAYVFLVGLIPVSLCFWYYKTIGEFTHPRVYFTYDHALLFISDALAVLAVLVWVCVRVSRPISLEKLIEKVGNRSFAFYLLFISLLCLSTVSAVWSSDWRTSIYISLHLWLVFLLILSMHDWKEARRPVMLGLCTALILQIVLGFTVFNLQSTHFLEPLETKWPGILDASVRGASVVQLLDGQRILRAYGSLPHPNILGGFALLCLLGPTSFFMTARRMNIPALILFSLGIVLMIETFSRSAWLGILFFLLVLSIKSRYLVRPRFYLLLAAAILSMILTLYPLRDMVFTRLGTTPVQTEQLSTFGRSWLNQQALDMILSNPFTGVGTGSFILKLAAYAVKGAVIEPVHNVILLIGAELGIPGMFIAAAMFIMVAINVSKVRTTHAILASAVLAGIGLISLFDHYFWSIAPGRLMLGLALGLWAGQSTDHDA
jgi:O-antigen ligase